MIFRLRSICVLFIVVLLCSSVSFARGGRGPGGNNPNPPKGNPNDPNAKRAPKPLPASSLQRLSDRLALLGERLLALKKLAESDEREVQIRRYRAFQLSDFKDKKREPKAEELIAWMFEPDKKTKKLAPFTLREAAMHALIYQKMRDPDLSSSDSGSRGSPRAKLCRDKVVKHLRSDDRYARGLADGLLNGLWKRPPEPGIIKYEPDDKTTWKAGKDAWSKYLKKK